MPDRKIRLVLTGSSASAVRAMQEVATAAEGAHAKVQAAGTKLSSAGHSMSALSVPLLAVGGYAVKTAANFQDAMTLIRTQAGASTGEVNKMGVAVHALAPKVGYGATELAKALYPIESVGLRNTHALDALSAAAKGAQVSGAALTDTSDAMAGALKTSMFDVKNASDAMSIMNGIVGQGKMHLTDLTAAMTTGILPAAKNAGLGFRDVGTALAAMSRQSIPPQDEATRLRLNLMQFEAPKNTALKALSSIGLGQFTLADDLRKPHGLVTALSDLRAHLHGLTKDQQNVVLSQAFGGAKGSGNIMGLLNAVPQMQSIQGPLQGAGMGQLDKAFGERKKDASFKFGAGLAAIQNAMGALGMVLVPLAPLIEKFASVLTKAVEWVTKLPKPIKDAAGGFVLLLAVGGPMLIFAGNLIKAFGFIGIAIRGVGVALDFLALNPIVLIIAAVALLGYGIIVAYKHFEAFRNVVDSVFKWLKGAASDTVGFVGKHWKLLASILIGPFGAAALFAVTHFDQIKHAAGSVVDWIANKFEWLIHKITGLFRTITGLPGTILHGLAGAPGAVGHLLGFHSGGLVPGFATGGLIGGHGNSDTQLARLTPGEFVMQRPAVQKVGAQNLSAINETGSLAGAQSSRGVQPIVIPVTLTMGGRVIAEEVAHYASRRLALS